MKIVAIILIVLGLLLAVMGSPFLGITFALIGGIIAAILAFQIKQKKD